MHLPVKLLFTESVLPGYATPGSAAFDLAATKGDTIRVGETKLIGTGLAMEIPQGFVGLVCSRSGLALKHSVIVLNAPGVIDSDYRGEVGVILHNLGKDKYQVKKGERIAQMMILPIIPCWLALSNLSETERGEGGFGSTGA